MRAKLDTMAAVTQTELGREWLLKALNPTEPSIAAVGMPDGTAVDTVCLELTQTQTVGASTLGIPITAPWGAKVLLTPHMYPGSLYPLDGAAAAAPFPFKYPIFTDTTPENDYQKLLALAEGWRLCGQSVTIHLDANSTKDSGTVVAAQMVTKPYAMFPGMSSTGWAQFPLLAWSEGGITHKDNPDYQTMMALPRCFQGNLRGGLYMPLKLNSTCQHWQSERETVIHVANDALTMSNLGMQLSTNNPSAFPFPFWAFRGPMRILATNEIKGYTTSPMMGDNWGHIAIAGVDPSSSLVFKFRTLLELKVNAVSSFAPHMKPAPLPDHMAIQNYFTITRELPDAYPADYNDAGKIMGVIGKAIRTVAPFLKFVPGAGPTLDRMADPVSKLLIETGKATSEARRAYQAQNGRPQSKKQKRQQRRTVAGGVVQQVAQQAANSAVKQLKSQVTFKAAK